MAATGVRLTVDGAEVRLIDTIRLFQGDPFPGGHRYSLSLIGEAPLPGIEPSSGLSPAEQQYALWAIELLAARTPGERVVPARYILNSVDTIRRSGSRLVIEGICSRPVLDN